MNFRHYVRRAVDYSIRVALVSFVVVPIWFFLSIGAGLGTEPADRWTNRIAFSLFVFFAPAYALVKCLHIIGIDIGVADWLVVCVSVPAFWGTVLYCAVQLFRYGRMSRQRLTNRCS
jgi:hypothetical protein